jgi:hypothetical protein
VRRKRSGHGACQSFQGIQFQVGFIDLITTWALFWELLVAFTDKYDIKMHVSWYQLIAMHCIVLPVKFDSGLPISVLRNEQLFNENWEGSKPISFQKA